MTDGFGKTGIFFLVGNRNKFDNDGGGKTSYKIGGRELVSSDQLLGVVVVAADVDVGAEDVVGGGGPARRRGPPTLDRPERVVAFRLRSGNSSGEPDIRRCRSLALEDRPPGQVRRGPGNRRYHWPVGYLGLGFSAGSNRTNIKETSLSKIYSKTL